MDPLLVRPTLVDVDVLDADECAGTAARVEALRPRWLVRGAGYATVGLAAYLDVASSDRPRETYDARLDEQNALLREHFGGVLDRVAAALAALLGMPARFDPGVALPGFHVFEGPGVAVRPVPSQHFDLQHRAIRWPFPVLPGEHAVSFTLAVALPRLGGALEFWDVTEAEAARLRRLGRTIESIGRTRPSRRHPYQVGRMAVQLAPLMHRIAAVPARFPGDRRVTLQGHGVRDADGWVLYW